MKKPVLANEPTNKIRSLFNIKNSFCLIKTNGVKGLDNRNSAYAGRGGGISSTNALLLLENGENEVSLEIGALGWFSKENITESQRGEFNSLASCKLDLVLFDDGKQKKLASIDVSIDKDGMPKGLFNPAKNTESSITLAEQAESGHIDKEYFSERYFPKGMKLYKFSNKISISGIPDWQWAHASEFTGSDEQLIKLQNAYSEIAVIINSRNRSELKKTHRIALKAWSTATGNSEDEILESFYPKNDMEIRKVKIDKIDWNDYSLRIMNKGRIIQLYNKSNPKYSPLTYHSIDEDGDEIMGYYAPHVLPN